MKTFNVIDDKSLLVRKLNPLRNRQVGKLLVRSEKICFEAGVITKAEILDSQNKDYPIGAYVFVLQQGVFSGHESGFGPLETSMQEGEEFKIQDKVYTNSLLKDREHIIIKVKTTDAFAKAELVNDCWQVKVMNKGYLIRIVNPMAGTDKLQKSGLETSRIIIPDKKQYNKASRETNNIATGLLMSQADDVPEKLDIGNQVVICIQGAEDMALDAAFDNKEWFVDDNKFIPKNHFKESEQDIRSLTHLHLVALYTDIMAVVTGE